MSFVLSQKSKDKLKGVHPDVVKVFEAAIAESPFDFKITHGVRTAEEQNKLFKQGRSLPGRIVTYRDGYKKKSNHQPKEDGYGHAVDICICGEMCDGTYKKCATVADMYSERKIRAVADHIKKVAQAMGITIAWGGDWVKFKDTPHFELG